MIRQWLDARRARRLETRYRRLLEQAQAAQRGGDMARFAERTAAAEEVGRELDALRSE